MPDIREGRPLNERELHELISLLVLGGRNIARAPILRSDGKRLTALQALTARVKAYRGQISLLEVYQVAPDVVRAEIRAYRKNLAAQHDSE